MDAEALSYLLEPYPLLNSKMLPRIFAYLALVMGVTLQIFGLLGLFNVLQPILDLLLIAQSFWIVAAAITLLIGTRK